MQYEKQINKKMIIGGFTTMTKEQLESMITEMIKSHSTSQGTALTETLTKQIEEVVKATVEEKFKVKEFVLDSEDTDEDDYMTEDPAAGFKSLSEFAVCVKNAEVTHGRNVDKRLDNIISKAAGSSVREGDSEFGGYLVPEEFRNDLLEIAINKSNIMASAMAIPMATNAINIPYIYGVDRSSGLLHGGVQFIWLDEEGQKTETRPKFGKIQLRLKKLAGLVYASDEILEDSPITLEPLLTRMFSDSLGWTLDNVFINGNGAGKPLGVLNAPCLISVDKEVNQPATTILYENILKMYARMYNKGNAVWYANEDTFKQLSVMSLAVGVGGVPVWLPAGGASGKPYDTLMGKPLIWTEHCQTLGQKGDILFTDWSQYLVGQKTGADGGMKFASSIHLKFDYDQTAFRFVFRVDGQPWWPAALTPRYSSDTLSPFVALAIRT
jgi:HK97 family phage major capsid protein